MTKSIIKNVIDYKKTQENKFIAPSTEQIKKFFIIATTTLLTLFIYQALNVVEEKNQSLNIEIQKKENIIKSYILENTQINKATNDVNELQLSEKDKPKISLKNFQNTISHLSYYYRIAGPIRVRISYINHAQTLNQIKINLSLIAKTDYNIIGFLDSLITNLDGFVSTQKIDISKKSGNIIASVDFDWYTLKKIGDSIKSGSTILVEPRISDAPIEDVYRISIWNGVILSDK